MDYGFDRVIDRYHTNCVKFDLVQKENLPEDVLPMWVADMDFQAPDCVRQALQKCVDFGIFGYSIIGDDYYEALENWFAARFNWKTRRDWVVTTPGVVFALSAAVRSATNPGDKVLVQPPVYYPFYRVIENNGRVCVENPLVYKNGTYEIDFQDFEQKIRENNVKLFILCSPHNPMGRVWTQAELQQIGRICDRYNVTVVADEIHCDFAFPEYPHTPFLKACPQMQEKTILCTAPSKTFNLAGMQVSNIFIPGNDLREAFRRQMQICCFSEPNILGMVACTAAYREGADWLDACKDYMMENLRYIRQFLKEHIPQIRVVEPQGTYLLWLDCSDLGLSQEELDELFLHKAKLWLDSGKIFGQGGQQFQRMVLACPRARVEQAMQQLKQAICG